jgi:hypothetical protein
MSKQSDAVDRENRYRQLERRVTAEFEPGLRRDALRALARCPRRSGLPAMGSYYCECPACTPEEWFGAED